jgi:hypothetical protein
MLLYSILLVNFLMEKSTCTCDDLFDAYNPKISNLSSSSFNSFVRRNPDQQDGAVNNVGKGQVRK